MSATASPPAWQACAVGQFQPKSVEWFWPNWLALGRPTLLEGDPGLKKSFLTLDLCARLSSGRAFPDGSPSPGPANALILSAEDRVEDTIAVRLHAMEADVNRVFVLRSTDERLPRRFCLLEQLGTLDQLLAEVNARLLIVDPVVSFVDEDINWSNDKSVRRLLEPLAHVAIRRRCAILLIRHLVKGRGNQAIYRGGGSIGVVAACRAAWQVGRDPRNPEHCVLAQVKSNLGAAQTSLVYGVESAGPEAPARLCWYGTSPLTADQLTAAQRAGESPRQRARAFLRSFLKEGPRTAREIWLAGIEQDLSRTTLLRARKVLQISSTVVVRDHVRRTYWLLPGQKLPPEIDPARDPSSLAATLAEMRAKWPDPTPLDE